MKKNPGTKASIAQAEEVHRKHVAGEYSDKGDAEAKFHEAHKMAVGPHGHRKPKD